jgi:hypothetical protein
MTLLLRAPASLGSPAIIYSPIHHSQPPPTSLVFHVLSWHTCKYPFLIIRMKDATFLFVLVFRLPAVYVPAVGEASANDRQEERIMTMAQNSAVFHNSIENILWNKVG